MSMIIVMILSLVSKIFGFARELILSYFYGTSQVADAFVIAQSVPFVLFNVVSVGFSTGYIPMYQKINSKESKEKADLFTNKLINIILIVSILFTILGILFSSQIINLFAVGFDPETARLATKFTKIMFTVLFSVGVASIFTGYLNIYGKFSVTTSTGLILNVLIIIGTVLSSVFGYIWLPITTAIAMLVQYIYYIPTLNKLEYKHSFRIGFLDKNVKSLLKNSVPIMIGMGANDINEIVMKSLASLSKNGGVSILNYASRLNGLMVGIVILSIGTIIFPKMSKLAVEGQKEMLSNKIINGIALSFLLILPFVVLVTIYSYEFVDILFGRGAFTQEDISNVSIVLKYYSISLFGISIRDIFTKAFYSLGINKTPVYNSIFTILLNIIFSYIFVNLFGITGLAVAYSLSLLIGGARLIALYKKDVEKVKLSKLLRPFSISIVSSIGMAGLVSFLNMSFGMGENYFQFILNIVIGALLYVLIIFITLNKDIIEYLD